MRYQVCPACGRIVIGVRFNADPIETVHPVPTSRRFVPNEATEPFRTDFMEASEVLRGSPKASAALSRRCLQAVLREKGGVKHSDLSKEIDEALTKLPSHLARAIDAVRNIGNFAAHPLNDTSTGSIVDVEPGEAEWLLDVLEGLFDFYFVQPDLLQKRRDALNAKLSAMGKPPLK